MVVNPCVNAREAMTNGGKLTLRAAFVDPDDNDPSETNQVVLITIEDDGPGMNPATARRAFEPFFSTKQRTGGTGLGLATVERVARDHRGRALVRSTPGHGTQISIRLPAATLDEAFVLDEPETGDMHDYPARAVRRELLDICRRIEVGEIVTC